MEPGHWKDMLQPVFAGRRWLLVYDVLVVAGQGGELLRDYGAPRPFCIAGSEGTGDPPDPELLEWAVLGTTGRSIMDGFRNFASAVLDLPADVVARIDAWDPDRSARAIGGFLRSDMSIAGRPAFGARWPEWEALEDKTTIDGLWDAAGVTRAPSEIVPAQREALLAAARRLDRGMGTVWAGDNREGWHGGAEYVRWAREPAAAGGAVAFMEEHCDLVRVMPFLDGIPCSIHGIVFPDRVATFRPAEIIILRRPAQDVFQYAGVASFWEMPPEDVEYLREAARRVGDHLRAAVDYRGAFGMDGVLTHDGWRPTELNARPAAGLGVLVSAAEQNSLGDLNRALVEGFDLEYRPAEYEAMIRVATAGQGRGGGRVVVSRHQTEMASRDIMFVRDAARLAADGEPPDATLSFGPGPQGGFVRVELDPARTPFGEPVGPRVAAALMLADRLWDLGLGPLEASPDVRRGSVE